ncbi:MAG: mercury(II) reductase [Desulfurococcales archaeon]|nr:mercury(II) reductase [Desulfurococcales archaeon]
MARYDLVVVGGGAAGFSAATVAAEKGARVALVSKGPLGGTCVNYGCVPTKYMLTALSRAKVSGLKVSLSQVIGEAARVSEKLRRERYEDLLESLDVDFIRGSARFKEKGVLEVNGRHVEYDKAVIAVGARTVRPRIPGVEELGSKGLDNESIMGLDRDPERVVVVGGRAQGVEFSQIMARSGVEVLLLQRSPSLLPTEEPEVGATIKGILQDDGVKVVTGVRLLAFKSGNGGVSVRYETGSGPREARADLVFFATGRRPVLEGLGLERVGVEVRGGFIVVDRHLKAAPGIYAAGDCIGEPMLEPVAAKEGYVAALNAIEGDTRVMDYTVVPRAVFTDPEFARVGYTEREFASKTGYCACRIAPLTVVPRAEIVAERRGFAKIVVDPKTHAIVGVHLVAPHASEAIHEAVWLVKKRVTLEELIDTVHVFPTMAESIKYAALSFFRDVRKMPCCLL